MPKFLLAATLSLIALLALTATLTTNSARPNLASSIPPPILEHSFYIDTAYARFTRWDCSDWQPHPAVADADNELASSILETLAANRGKTLYCALDQSDTWTKRQVYDNAHAHNDRDRTQYDGSQGQGRFRGFTAGQEGWLTDGEHGITGVSPERIFEFPEQKRRRRWTWKRRSLSDAFQYGMPDNLPAGAADLVGAAAQGNAQTAFLIYISSGGAGESWYNAIVANLQSRVKADARAKCRDLGYSTTRSIKDSGSGQTYYSVDLDSTANFQFKASRERLYTATCYKRVRR